MEFSVVFYLSINEVSDVSLKIIKKIKTEPTMVDYGRIIIEPHEEYGAVKLM